MIDLRPQGNIAASGIFQKTQAGGHDVVERLCLKIRDIGVPCHRKFRGLIDPAVIDAGGVLETVVIDHIEAKTQAPVQRRPSAPVREPKP